ncbi:MAG: hypothetical protein OWQ48_00900 [Desulfurococcus sp.]|nr:hypothetical protein [Desulfurococcus sp.]
MSGEPVYVVRVGGKEIVIDEKTLSVLQEYIKTPMGLEDLADKLGLEGWEEAYEFIKAIPAWVLWTQPSLWKYRKKWIEAKLKAGSSSS